jgi:hypothetical protein
MVFRPVLVLVLATSASATAIEDGWTHDLDLATGFSTGTVTAALSEVSAFGLFEGRLRLGAGPRLLGAFGGDGLSFSTADADLIAAGRIETLAVSGVRTGALNLALSARVRVWAGLELGANIDVVGVGFGRTRPVSSGGVQTDASPPTLNLLALGRKDRGTLDSEFFVAWWFGERVAVRVGASHLVTELVTRTPLQDGNDRFRRSSTQVFIAVTFRP